MIRSHSAKALQRTEYAKEINKKYYLADPRPGAWISILWLNPRQFPVFVRPDRDWKGEIFGLQGQF
jgi:hypothetical protein